MEKLVSFLFCVIPLGSFVYWVPYPHGSDDFYSGTELLWGVAVTVILTVFMYLYSQLHKKIELFSPAWALVVGSGSGLFLIGLTFQHIIGYAWGAYMWFFFLWFTVYSVVLPKEFKRKVSFFKRTASS